MKTFTGLLVATLSLFAVACDDAVEIDAQTRFATFDVEVEPGSLCEEEYYFVVDGETKREAKAACEDICEGIICPDWEMDATAHVPGNAGDEDTWLCDCRCGCDDAAELEVF